MITVNIHDNEIKNSIATKDLSTYLNKKGHNVTVNTKLVDGAKCELVIGIAIATLAVATYPMIKDLQNWIRPKRYSLSMTDGNVIGTINDLTEEEYIKLLEKLNKDITKIEIN